MSKLWGGRFSKKTNKCVEKFTNSIHFDQKLAKHDCIGSLRHIAVLKKAKLLTPTEYSKLKKGLERILTSIKNNKFKVDDSFEDIHSYIQHCLEKDKNVGNAALKLHTCRSRNDQVVFDTKLYCINNLDKTSSLLGEFSKILMALAKKNEDIIMPGYTHLQHAIPVKLSEHLSAYALMLARDQKRLKNALENISLTLGAGALAGTFIASEHYEQTAKIDVTQNSIDAVSDRDFTIEALNGLSIIGMHLSRLAEDMILWASTEFDFIDIDDAFCTGSSLMPQKKNPDVLELVRGYTGRLYGNLINALVMMKGLPLSYNRDMQHDKEPLLDSFKVVKDELNVLTQLFKNVKFKKKNIQKQLDDESLYATDLSDYLVQKGVPFKKTHAIIGKLIQYKYKKNKNIRKMSAATLKGFHALLTPAVVKKIIDPKTSVASKKSVRKTRRKT